MHTLGIETSGLEGSVALVRNDETVAERRLATQGRRHAQTLLAEVDELLRSAQLSPRDIDGIAVSLGPGSFTGLRVGVVCAKTWAYATGCKLVGIETFTSLARQCPCEWQAVWVVSDAQRGDLFAAEYHCDANGQWARETPIAIVSAAEWLPNRTAREHIIGPGVLRVAADTTPAQLVIDEWATQPSAAAVAQAGAARLLNGEADDAWTLAPIYIRPSAAEEKSGLESRL